MSENLTVALLIYPGFTSLDVVGPYEILHMLPGAETFFVAEKPGPVTNDGGSLTLVASRSLDEVPSADVVVVGGGVEGTLAAAQNPAILSWVRRVHNSARMTFSVCTGSLILGAAGLLAGRRACTHWAARELLEKTGASYCEERYHLDGTILTAAGVSAGLDAALFLVSELRQRSSAEMIQLVTEYDPAPPFTAGSTRSAPPEIVTAATARFEAALARAVDSS
ncbi:MAG: DJ-1/PfpI family protein [Acidobacteriota bacterium]